MGRELNHFEVRELLGAYALDAVDGDEAEAVERHLAECTICRTEVGEHREVASLLASGWLPAPDGVWDRIASSLEESPPSMRPPLPLGAARERRRERQSGPVRAAAAVAVAAVIGLMGLMVVKVLDTSHRVDDVAASIEGDVEHAAAQAAHQNGARHATLTSTDGRYTAEAVLLSDGTGYLTNTNLPKLSAGRTYQLWAVTGTQAISVGVLGDSPRAVAFRAAGDVGALAITDEVAGGVVASQRQPTVVGTVT